MPVKMLPTSTIKMQIGIQPSGPVQRFFQNTCYRYMDKYVPYRKGNLRREVDLSNPKQIVYEMPYAHYIYEGIKYVMDNGKSAYYSPTYGFWSKPLSKGGKKKPSNETLNFKIGGPHWDERMWSAEGKDVVSEVQQFIDRGGK